MSAFAATAPAAEARHELAAAAARNMTRNRPLHWLMLALVLFAAGFVMLLLSVSAKGSAQARLKAERRQSLEVQALVDRLVDLEAQARGGARNRHEPVGALKRFEEIKGRTGLKSSVATSENTVTLANAIKRTYVFNLREDSLEVLMRWVRESMEHIPGLELSGIELKPEPSQWSAKVTFVRWERKP